VKTDLFCRRAKGRPFLPVFFVVAALIATLIPSATASADVGDVGYEDQSFSGVSTPTGTKRNESVLWFNDGHWWAHMWDTVSQDYHIYKLDTGTQTWVDSGTLTDPRVTSHADALWDGTHLYVASHVFVNDELPAASGFQSRLYRYSYDTTTDTYTLDAGFPVQINNYKTETLVLDKDSTGKLWATWQQDNQIYVNSTQGDDAIWGTPSALPVTQSAVTVDDNSSLVAFGGNKIGVMWSNQTAGNEGMWFSVHNDGDAESTWSTPVRAVEGIRSADDHMNLKGLSNGMVLAAIKTEFTTPTLPLTSLLVRNTSGSWSNHTVGTVAECPNRPTVLADETNNVVHVLQTGPAPPDFSCNTTGGAIYEKTSSLSSISFESGNGTPVMLDADNPALHNVSSTKQNLSSASGLAALAINAVTDRYWHHYASIAAPPPVVLAPVANFTGSPLIGDAPLTVNFTDSSTENPTSWAWSFGNGATSTAQNPSHTYTLGGQYTVSLTATNASGSDTETKPQYVTVRDFTVSGSPDKRQIVTGQSTSFAISVAPQFGYTGTVNLSVSGVPSGATASLSQSSVTVPPTGSATLNVSTSGSIKQGNYNLTIRATSGALTRTYTVQLQVKKK
jgi:PKD repeat protein